MSEINKEDVELLEQDNEELDNFVEEIEDETIKKPFQTLNAQKRHFREKFEKEKEAKEALEAKLAELKKEPKKEVESTPDTSRIDLVEQKVELRMEGYSPDEIKYMETYAKGSGTSLSEVKDNPFVQSAIQGIRKEKKVEDAIPSNSKRAAIYNGKTFDEVVKGDNISSEDKQAAFEALREKIKK